MQTNVKHIGDERLSRIPTDLDLKPYRDEHDTDLLERMARAIERGHHPSSHHPDKLHKALHATMSDIKANTGTPRYVAKLEGKAAKPKRRPARHK